MKKLLTLIAVFVMAMSLAQATDILLDDFEGIADQTALDAANQTGGWISAVTLDAAGHAGQCITITYADTGGDPWYGSTKMAVLPSIDANAMTHITYWAKTTAASTGHQLNLMTLDPLDLPLDYSADGAVFDPLFNAAGVGASYQSTSVTAATWTYYAVTLGSFATNTWAFNGGGLWAVPVDWSSVDNVEYQVGANSGDFSIDDVMFTDSPVVPPTATPTTPSPTPDPTPFGPNLLVNGDFAAGVQAPWVEVIVSNPTVVPTLDWNTSADGPAGGTAPCLSWSASTTGWSDPEKTNRIWYQPVTLMAGCEYQVDMLIKEVTANEGYWVETNVLTAPPVEGVDMVGNLAGYGSWVPGHVAGFDGPRSSGATPFVADGAGTYYFAVKIGRTGPGAATVLIDNIQLRFNSVVPVELLEFSAE